MLLKSAARLPNNLGNGTSIFNVHCVVPESIHTHPIEVHRKFLGTLEEKYEAKLEFPGG